VLDLLDPVADQIAVNRACWLGPPKPACPAVILRALGSQLDQLEAVLAQARARCAVPVRPAGR
jgi:hypothetical protein